MVGGAFDAISEVVGSILSYAAELIASKFQILSSYLGGQSAVTPICSSAQ